MSDTGGPVSAKAAAYLAAAEVASAAMEPAALVQWAERLTRAHERWRRRATVNLLASDNRMSARARALLDSDLATRVTEGIPGDKEFPPPAHNVYVDQLEGALIALLRRLARAQYVEWRALTTTMANAIVLRAVTRPGDRLLVQSLEGGANASYQEGAVPSVLGLTVDEIPPTETYEIQVDAVADRVRRARPKVIVVGGSYVLFPYPVRELAAIARDVDAVLLYDAAHVASLTAGDMFQQPLAEGADVVTFGTHKSMGGPVGGVVATDRASIADAVSATTHPGFMQTRDENKYAAAVVSMAEMLHFAPEYARQMVVNAKALAAALERSDFPVLGSRRGYTETHQVMLDARMLGGARVQAAGQACRILIHKARMLGDGPTMDTRSAVRLSTQEVTRQGMGVDEMEVIAGLLADAVFGRRPPAAIRSDVAELACGFPGCRYSFDHAPVRRPSVAGGSHDMGDAPRKRTAP